MSKKPKCKLIGTDGNIYALIGQAKRSLNKAGLHDKAQEMVKKVMHSESYDKALQIILEYVDAY